MHRIEPTLAVSEYLSAQSRAAGAVDGTGIDLTKYVGSLHFLVSVGTVGASGTVDAKVQESDDNSTFTDVSGATITQITAATSRELNFRVRQASKRYVRLRLTTAVAACVSSVALIAKPLKAES
jgi:hypothetical protein